MGKVKTLVLFLLLLPYVIYGAGVTGADILKTDIGIRAIAMGSAYSAAGTDVESINFNPAGIAFITEKEGKAYYVKNYAGSIDEELYNISYAQPLETSFMEGSIAIEGTYLGMPSISNDDAVDPAVAYNNMLIKGTYAVNAAKLGWIPWADSQYLNLGISAAIVMEQIGKLTASGLSFDAGSQFVLYNTGFKFAAVIQNMGLPYKFVNESSPLPLTLRLGASYYSKVDKQNDILVSADYIQDIYNYARFAAGAEDTIMKIFYLRAGYNTSIDTRNASYASFGAGMNLKLADVTLVIDYTFRMQFWNGFNGNQQSHLAGIGFKI
jgi:hypothetical protein